MQKNIPIFFKRKKKKENLSLVNNTYKSDALIVKKKICNYFEQYCEIILG